MTVSCLLIVQLNITISLIESIQVLKTILVYIQIDLQHSTLTIPLKQEYYTLIKSIKLFYNEHSNKLKVTLVPNDGNDKLIVYTSYTRRCFIVSKHDDEDDTLDSQITNTRRC